MKEKHCIRPYSFVCTQQRVLNVQNIWETSYVAHSLKNEFKIFLKKNNLIGFISSGCYSDSVVYLFVKY